MVLFIMSCTHPYRHWEDVADKINFHSRKVLRSAVNQDVLRAWFAIKEFIGNIKLNLDHQLGRNIIRELENLIG